MTSKSTALASALSSSLCKEISLCWLRINCSSVTCVCVHERGVRGDSKEMGIDEVVSFFPNITISA